MAQPIRRPPMHSRTLGFVPRFQSLPEIGTAYKEFVREVLGGSLGGKPAADLKLAVQEAAANLIEHGELSEDSVGIAVDFEYEAPILRVHLTTRGRPFDPRQALSGPPDPEKLAEGGYGIYLMHVLTDSIEYFTGNGEQTLTLSKSLVPGNERG